MSKPISEHMRRTLLAVASEGGVARPEGGGYWKAPSGARLTYEPLPGSSRAQLGEREPVGTTTIRALAARGLMIRVDDERVAHWRRDYKVTTAGYEEAAR